jgi:hypothetical protein
MTFTVSLPLGDFDLMVVANANAMLNTASSTLVKGTAHSAVEEAIQMSMSIDGWEDDPTNPAHFIPLWGYVRNVNVPEDFTGANTTLSSDIHLTRMVSKVNLSLGADLVAADKFELQTVRVYNYSRQGRLIPATGGSFDWTAVDEAADLRSNTTPSLPTGDIRAKAANNEYIDYTVADGRSLIGSIYLFEAPAGVSPVSDPADYLENVCLVIGGSYNEGATTFYRIDFARDTDTNPGDDVHNWQYLPLMRNNSYTITITDIRGEGHVSQDDALNSAPVNIDANMLDWNNENIGTVITNSVYSLGVSQGAFEFAGPKLTAAGEGNELLLATDYSGGWSAEIFDRATGEGTTSRSWLSLNTSGTSKVNQATADKDAGGTWMTLLTADNDTAASRTAYIRITAGTLVYWVEVVQTNVIPSSITITDENGLPIPGDLLRFALDNPGTKKFKVTWLPGDKNLTIDKALAGVENLVWSHESYGKTTLTGSGVNLTPGTYTFTVDPAAITGHSRFYNNATRLTFKFAGTGGAQTDEAVLTLFQGDDFKAVDPGLAVYDVTYPYTGGTQNLQIASYARGDYAGKSGYVMDAVRWVAEFSTDGGATWGPTPPAWISGFPTSGKGTPTHNMINIPVAATRQTGVLQPNTENDNLRSAAERGAPANRWNLAGDPTTGAATVETANCYVVNAAGYYKLPLYFGNAFDNTPVAEITATHASAIDASGRITGAANATVVWQDAPNLITHVGYDATGGGFLTFDVPKANIMQGNAVVAIRDASNKILWSWHIWVTPTSIFDVAAPATDAITTRAVSPTIEYTNNFLKYNLGHASPTETRFAARSMKVRITQTGLEAGLEVRTQTITVTQNAGVETTGNNNPYYQWGRKDPFPPSNGNNNTERMIYYGAGYSRVFSGGPTTDIDEAIVNPHIFYRGTEAQPNWMTVSYNDLWDLGNAVLGGATFSDNTVVKTVYDPSPVGFKMPPSNAFRGFTYSGNIYVMTGANVYSDFFNVSGPFSGGWTFYSSPNARGGTAGTPIFFPASGYRYYTTETLGFVNANGSYWSALPTNAINSSSLNFNSGFVNPLGSNPRSYGFSVRPVAE